MRILMKLFEVVTESSYTYTGAYGSGSYGQNVTDYTLRTYLLLANDEEHARAQVKKKDKASIKKITSGVIEVKVEPDRG
jgi:hypothetical protein